MLRAIFCFFMLMNLAYAKNVTVPASDAPPLVLKPGSEISIVKYMKDADVFVFKINAEPSNGPNFASPEGLQKAIGRSEPREDFMREMLRDTSVAYVTKKPLTLIWDVDVEARKKKLQSKKSK